MALSRATTGNPSIWQVETATGRDSVLTSDTSQVSLFSPDGSEIVFSKAGPNSVALFKKPVNGGNETEKPLLVLPEGLVATDWSHDHLLFRSNNDKTGFDIQALPMRGNEPAGPHFPVVQTEYSERDAQFSPDGKWIAYESDSSGISEIYLHPFPGPGRAQQVSKGGGVQARWNPRGKELFYISLDGRLMAVAIRFAPDGSIEASDPVVLFRTRMGTVFFGVHTQQYLVSDDGQRFLISTIADNAVSPINLILNWRVPSE
jgi:Tol biopolymer transport system component